MAEIKVMIDGKEYAKEQYEKDMIRMFDAYRYDNDHMGEMNCKDVGCSNCPLKEYCDVSRPKTFEEIKIIYKWAQEHPVFTNKDMLEKTFGEYALNHISSSLYRDLWLKQEYKEPSKEPRKEEK